MAAEGPLMVLCAFDKFKGTLDARGVGEAVAEGIRAAGLRACEITNLPLSDGGDGFVALLAGLLSLELHEVPDVVGPMGDRQPRVTATYASNADHSLAVLEMASAAGLALVPPLPLDVAHATTYGVGQLLAHVHQRGARSIILGLGGSATNDAGLGALQALGVEMTWNNNTDHRGLLDPASGAYACGAILNSLETLSLPPEPHLPGARLSLACDVTNPFVGARGAVEVFSAQKGATDPALRAQLEEGMVNAARLLQGLRGLDVSHFPGAGAAGGIAGGLLAALDCQLVGGMDLVSQYLDLEGHIRAADLVVTGEGAFDLSTDDGKVVSRVISLALRHRKPVLVVCGASTHPSPPVPVFPLLSKFSLELAMSQPATCLSQLASECFSQWIQRG